MTVSYLVRDCLPIQSPAQYKFRCRANSFVRPKSASICGVAIMTLRPLSWTTDTIASNSIGRHAYTSCRSDENTSELQSLMRRSHAGICVKNKNYIPHRLMYTTNNTKTIY